MSIFGSSAISITAGQSGATLAATIAGLINASTLATANAKLPANGQVRNTVYARATGATLEIMCRIGSSLLNVLGVVWGGTWTAGTPTSLTFAGGVGGCWGWFINPFALGASSSIPVMGYGVMLFTPYCANTVPSYADKIFLRSGGGASKTIEYTVPGALNVSRSAGYYPQLITDTNTQWSGDSAVGTLSLQINAATANDVHFSMDIDNYSWSLSAIRRSGFNLVFNPTGNSFLNFRMVGSSASYRRTCFRNVRFDDLGGTSLRGINLFAGQYGSCGLMLLDCDYYRMTAQATKPAPFKDVITFYAASYVALTLKGNTFNYNISGMSDPGAIVQIGTPYGSVMVDMSDNAFSGFAEGFTPISGWSGAHQTSVYAIDFLASDNTGLKTPPSYYGMPYASLLAHANQHRSFWSSEDAFRMENVAGAVEWMANSATAYPHYAAKRPDGVTGWSLRVWWLPGMVSGGWPFVLPALTQTNKLNPATTVKLRLFAPNTELFDPSSIQFEVSYVSGGVTRTETLPVPAASGDTWGNAGLYAGYVALSTNLTVSNPIALNTEVSICAKVTGNPSVIATTTFYIDPEFELS